MKESDKEKRKKLITEAVVVAIIVAIIAIVVILLTYRRETHIIEKTDDGDTSALVCTSQNNDDLAFFKSDTAVDVEHVVKSVYSDGKINKMSYEYIGDYESKGVAEHDDAVLHARYNIYMGEHDKKSESLTPVFQVVNDKLTIKLYLESYSDMNSVIGKLFYIGSGLEGTIGKNSINDTKKYYEKRGFSCIISE